MDDAHCPIDPWNPLGYTPRDVDFDAVDRPCDDFHHTLAWAFWICGGLAGGADKTATSSFQWVRHLRHLTLMGLEQKAMDSTGIVTPRCDFRVVSACEAGKIGVLVSRIPKDAGESATEHAHFFREAVWDHAAILNAVNLNRDLHCIEPRPFIQRSGLPANIRQSPFGPADTLMPPEIRPSMIQGGVGMSTSGMIIVPEGVEEIAPRTRTIRLFPESSEGYLTAVRRLGDCKSLIAIQIFLDAFDCSSMKDEEFARFCTHDLPRRVQEVKSR